MNTMDNSSGDDFLSVNIIKKHILPYYGLYNADIDMIKFKDTEKQRAVYKITYNNSLYCLKKVYYDEANLLFVYSAMEWLYRNGLNISRLVPSLDGNRFVVYNNMLFILTYWIKGDKCDFDKLIDLKLSAKTLGKIHRTTKDFVPISNSKSRVALNNYNTVVVNHFNTILENANLANVYKDKFSKLFLENLNYNLELAKIALNISSSINESNLSKSLCHGDYVNKNILISNNVVYLIDFDKCTYDYSAHDIAYFLRRLLKRPSTNWNSSLTLEVFDSYLENNNLTESDFKYILSYLAFPQKFWKISRDYFKNIKKCNSNSFCTLFEKSMERNENQLDYINRMIRLLKIKYNVNF